MVRRQYDAIAHAEGNLTLKKWTFRANFAKGDILLNGVEAEYGDIKRAPTQQMLLVKIFEASPDGTRSPTLRELTDGVGKSAGSNILRALDELEKKSYIERDRVNSTAAQARGIWLTRRALGWLRLNKYDTSRYVRAAIAADEIRLIPLLGEIAAGNPISPEAYIPDQDVEEYVPLPARHLPIGMVFLLKVSGDSMTGDGILDGDQVIVVPFQATPRGRGEIVVAVIDNDATVKHLYSEGETYRLEPSNNQYNAQIVEDGDNFYIQGRVVGVVRIKRDGL